MMYEIEWKENAIRELEKLESSLARRILKKIDELSESPFSKDLRRLKGSDYFRFRVGDYRIIFAIEQNIIQILKVGHRKNIYNK